jgi:hypothetical protein
VARRSGAAAAAPIVTSGFPAAEPKTIRAADERLNDEIHGLMRDAAELRDSRHRAQAAEDRAAAARQLEDVFALARKVAGKDR